MDYGNSEWTPVIIVGEFEHSFRDHGFGIKLL